MPRCSPHRSAAADNVSLYIDARCTGADGCALGVGQTAGFFHSPSTTKRALPASVCGWRDIHMERAERRARRRGSDVGGAKRRAVAQQGMAQALQQGMAQARRAKSRFASRSSSTAVCSQSMSALVDRSVQSDTLSTSYRARATAHLAVYRRGRVSRNMRSGTA
jgi:hypothetical protein